MAFTINHFFQYVLFTDSAEIKKLKVLCANEKEIYNYI